MEKLEQIYEVLKSQFVSGYDYTHTPEFTLPRDVSSSAFWFHLRENKILSLLVIIEIFIFAIVLFVLLILTEWLPLIIVLIVSLLVVPASVFLGYLVHYGSLSTEGQLHLLKEVVVERPGLEPAAWDLIALHVNHFLYENHLFPHPTYFYDGKSCHKYFEQTFVRSTSSSMGDRRDRHVNIRPFIKNAVQAYEESCREQWARMIGTVPVSAPDHNADM
ncbi:LAFE_0A02322g1_1 [Lachancea fermentati]|uniref:LAFE_0A02322g1_1 n=1 Tax=Lachancea fermentati TaxID=4955 RepID=A0A1G4M6H4_LACFM|nr:LAFE_0A02322g1_1 [Lachancea fermentati]